MRDWFRILIMFSVCQFGTAPETGKHADATFDAGVVVLLKQELASQAQCADNPITLSYADQRHHEFILERSDDALDLGVDLQFQHDLCAADIDAHRRAQGNRTQYSPKQTPTKYNGPAASSTTAARSS